MEYKSMLSKDGYVLNKNQYEHIRYYNNRQDTFSNLNKKDFFIQNDIEELLI